MYKVKLTKNLRLKRKVRIRSRLVGDNPKPRITVFRSNKYIYGQIIDDKQGITLVTIDNKVKDIHKGKNKVQAAFESGKMLAQYAVEKGIKDAAFDRNGYRYHGRVKSFADGVREGGLKI